MSILMEPQFTSDWLSVHIPLWQTLLRNFVGKPHLQFLEVGSFEGRSACWLLQNVLTHPTSRITCVDPFGKFRIPAEGQSPHEDQRTGPEIDIGERFDSNIAAIGMTDRVTKMTGESKRLLRGLPFHHYQFIYIDGAHDPRNVLRDAVLCWDLLCRDGIMLFDDYGLNAFLRPWQSPRLGIDAFLSVFSMDCEFLHIGWQVALRKKKELTVVEHRHLATNRLFDTPLSP